MADYLWRLAVVLPLILLAILAVLLVLHRRRGGAFPAAVAGTGSGIGSGIGGGLSGLFSGWRGPAADVLGPPEPLVLRMQAISPVARIVVLRFAGREHLLGISGDAMLVIASAPEHPGAPGLAADHGEVGA